MSDKKLDAAQLKDNISNTVIDLAKIIAPKIELDENGVTKDAKDVVGMVLEQQGGTLADLKKYQKITTLATDAVSHAFGEASIKAMKSDKKLERTKVKVPFGEMVIDGVFDRTKDSRNPTNGVVTTYHGNLSVGAQFKNAKNKGQQKHIRAHLRALADETYG